MSVLQLIDRRLRELERTVVRYRRAEVDTASPLEVTLGGGDTPVPAVSLQSGLETGDQVHALTFGADMLVLGTSGGAAGSWTRLGDFTNNGTTLDYGSIPQTYTHLKIIATMQSNRASLTNTGSRLRINGVGTSYYTQSGHYGNSNGNAPVGFNSRTAAQWYFGQMPANNRANDNCTLAGEILLPYYRAANYYRTFQATTGGDDGTNALFCCAGGSFVGNTNAITSLTLGDDVGSTLGPRSRADLWAV